jgi:hypothetical protein
MKRKSFVFTTIHCGHFMEGKEKNVCNGKLRTRKKDKEREREIDYVCLFVCVWERV